MDQVATLTTGWEPDTPLDDSVVRQFVFAYADRVAWTAQATHGRVDRDAAACIADVGSAFGYDNAAVLLQPPTQTALLAVLNRARPTRPAILLASDDGRNIYRQLGFLDLVRFTIWEHQPAP